MRDWKGDLAWYQSHQTTAQIGFNPDGMCLAVCRTSRDIGPRYSSAKQAQDNTPKEFRVYRIRDLRRGMKIFIDDPNDSNKFGHIVTMAGRVKGFQWDDPNDILVWTNSVSSGRLVLVRLTYFKEHWGDSFQFGAFWLNGQEFDYPGWKHDGKGKDIDPIKADHAPRIDNFRDSGPKWDVKILDRALASGRIDLKPKIHAIEKAVKGLPEDRKDTRVNQFTDRFEKDRVLDMKLLDDAVTDGRMSLVKAQRDDLRAAIKSVLRHR
jgi:hypothetical protein